MADATTILAAVLRRARRHRAVAQLGDAACVGIAAAGLIATAMRAGGIEAMWPAVLAGVGGFVALWRPPPTLANVADQLDARHGLSNLLGSVWAMRADANEPWQSTVKALAAGRAATLPPLRDVARFSARQRACGLAAVAAVWLAAGLVPHHDAGSGRLPGDGGVLPRGAEDASQIADVVRRQPDTADDASPASGRMKSETTKTAAGEPPLKPATGDTDANGAGRADARTPGVLPPGDPSAAASTRSNGPGGSGRAVGTVDAAAGAGTLFGDSADAVAEPESRVAAVPTEGRTNAVGVPDAYRDLVRDFFAR